MNICLFTEVHLKGGVDTFLINLVNAWPDKNDNLTLVCNSSHPGLDTFTEKIRRKVKIQTYWRFYATNIATGGGSLSIGQIFPVRAFFVLTFRLLQYPILFPWYVFSLSLKFRFSNFDRLLVVNGGYPASILCRSAIIAWRLSGKTTLGVMNFHAHATLAQRRYRYLEEMIDNLVAKSSAYIVTVSKNCLESLNNRPALRLFQSGVVIPNGIEDPLMISDYKENEHPITPIKEPYLLMLANYQPMKGHSFLLEAFQLIHRQHPEVNLRIYGYSIGSQKEMVLREVKRLGLESAVILNDFTINTYQLIRNARILVAPSQEFESFNLTIVEAMACGVPVVTTDVGGMPEVIGDTGAGYVSAKDDPIEFASKIREILTNKSIESSMRINGRQAFEDKFMASSMATKYWSLLLGLTSKKDSTLAEDFNL